MPYVEMQCVKCGRTTKRHHNARKCYHCDDTTLQPTTPAEKISNAIARVILACRTDAQLRDAIRQLKAELGYRQQRRAAERYVKRQAERSGGAE